MAYKLSMLMLGVFSIGCGGVVVSPLTPTATQPAATISLPAPPPSVEAPPPVSLQLTDRVPGLFELRTAGQPIEFTVMVFDTQARLALVRWEFGDGSSEEESYPPAAGRETWTRHTYRAGVYLVTVTVTMTDGRTGTAWERITVL